MAGKTYPLLAASLAAVFALSACSRDVKPAPEFKRTDMSAWWSATVLSRVRWILK